MRMYEFSLSLIWVLVISWATLTLISSSGLAVNALYVYFNTIVPC